MTNYAEVMQGQYDKYVKHGSMRLSREQLLTMAEDLNQMRWVVNAHGTGIDGQDGLYGSIATGLDQLLGYMFGPNGVEVREYLLDTGCSVHYALKAIRANARDEADSMNHIASPGHEPGTLYDCPACENYCQCDMQNYESTEMCIHCADVDSA